jgi:hypothetical protein
VAAAMNRLGLLIVPALAAGALAAAAHADLGNSGPVVFDFVAVGTTSDAKPAIVRNLTGDPATIRSIGLDGKNAGDFRVVQDGCTNVTLPPSGRCTVAVAFRPRLSGTRTAALVAKADSCSTWVTLAGSGTDTGDRSVSARAAGCDATTAPPAATTTPTTTPTPGAPTQGAGDTTKKPASLKGAIGFPARCGTSRTLTIKVKAPKGLTLRTATAKRDGHKLATASVAKKASAALKVNGSTRKFKVSITLTVSDGRSTTASRTYAGCAKKR